MSAPSNPEAPHGISGQVEHDTARIEAEIAGTDGGIDPFPAAVRATRMPMVITDPRRPDNPIVFANEAFCRLTGYARAEVLGRNCRFLQGPETDPEDARRIRAAVQEPRSIEIEIRNHRKDGTPFWNRLLLAPVNDAAGRLAYFFASQLDITLERERLAALEGENAALTAERRVNAHKLQFSEESLRLATDAAEIGTWDLDLPTGSLTWSVRTKAMFGIAPDVVCSMADFYAGLHPDDREATGAAFASALDPALRATYDVEYRTVGKEDGVVRWVAAKGRGLFDEAGRCIRAIGTAIDVTARRSLDDRLRRSEAELRELNATLEARVAERTAERDRMWRLSSDIMLVGSFEGEIVAINPAWAALLGRTEEALIGDSFLDFVHPDDVAATLAEMGRLAEGHTTLRFENRYRHEDGTWRWISWTAVPDEAFIHAVGRDVTAERTTSEALARSEARIRSIFETSFSFQGLLSPEGILLDANPASLAAIDASLPDVAGRPYWETPWFSGTPGVAQEIRDAIPRVAAGEVFRQEITVRLPTGERAFDLSLRPVLTPSGTIIGIMPEAMELTERRRAEEALRQAQKMEAVGQLTGGIAHDFNNLLTVIRSAADFLRRRELSEERKQRYVAAISDTADRAAKLTGQLLAFARQQPLKPEVFEVGRQVASVAEMVRSLLGSRIRLDVAMPEAPLHAEADVTQFETALVNLSVNARDAMDGEGALTITVAETRFVPPLRRHARREGAYVAISVRDTGTGIAPDHLAKIFEPFFTTKSVGKGTGLGLSQVFGFAKQSGGDVAVRSEPGQGTTFTIYLRRSAPRPGDDAGSDAGPQATAHGYGARVLVVEDNTDVGDFASHMLQDLGYATTWVPDAYAALALIADDPDGFDVVFTDVIMPGLSGIELAQELRRLHPRLPIVLTSGYSTVLAEEGRHGFELLQKPYSVEAMARVLRNVIRQHGVPRR